jgi:hypothetical protein
MFLFLMERETIIYNPDLFKGPAYRQYQKDLKRRQKDGWQLVSCAESGPLLTAIYECGAAAPGPAMNVQNLSLLLSMLSPQERTNFEGEVQAVVNQWLARKAA